MPSSVDRARRRIVWLVCLLVGWAHPALAEEMAFRRWAVIASAEMREIGISDVLTAELSARSFALVEREQLDVIAREIELSTLLSADAAAQRLQVGQLAKADALVLLSVVENANQKFAKLVISDCRYGSRLRLEHIAIDKSAVDKLAVQIAGVVDETRTKFANGVQRIVAVSPLLSNNLTHEFDHLQFGFSAVLGEALNQRAGIAVMEIEEARAISEELARTGTGIEGRRVPLFVEGEFEVGSRAKPDERTVRLHLKALSGKDLVADFRYEANSNSDAVKWLSDDLANQLLSKQVAGNKKSVGASLKEQRERLIARAETFSQVTAYSQAAALREAALLLDESDWPQRVLLLRDYVKLLEQLTSALFTTKPAVSVATAMERDPVVRQRMHVVLRPLWFAVFAHFDRLIAADVLNPCEAVAMLDQMRHGPVHNLEREPLEIGLLEDWHRICWRTLERLGQLDSRLRECRFHAAVAQFAEPHLEIKDRTDDAIYDLWAAKAMHFAALEQPRRFIAGNYLRFEDAETLASLVRVMDRVLLPDRLSSRLMFQWLGCPTCGVPKLVRSGRIPEAKLVAFLRRWSDDSRPVVSIYGRAALLGLKVSNSTAEPITPEDVELVTALERQLVEWGQKHPEQRDVAAKIVKELIHPTRAKLQQPVSRSVASSTRLKPRTSTGGTDPAPRLTFEPLPEVQANWIGLRRCSETLDLVWSWNRVALLTSNGGVTELFQTKFNPVPGTSPYGQDQIYIAAWDGELVWVASSLSGVQVFDPQGQRLDQLRNSTETSASGMDLPPITENSMTPRGASVGSMNTSLWLYPLRSGRCFVMGRYGVDGRRWFGCLEPTSDVSRRWRYAPWHEVKKQAVRAPSVGDEALDEIFIPQYFVDYHDPSSGQRSLLIGRPSLDLRLPRKPLSFDAASGAPSVFPHAVARGSNKILEVDDAGIIDPASVFNSRAVRQSDGRFVLHALVAPVPVNLEEQAKSPVSRSLPQFRSEVVRYGNWFYWPGRQWRRIDRKTGDIELLTSNAVIARFDFECYAESAHYGFVAWNHGDILHRVHIDQPRDKERDADWLYPFVPQAEREKHHRAVLAIRQLGGEVESVPTHEISWNGRQVKYWRTALCLTAEWKGGDEGLKHLLDLHDVQEIVLCGAAVTDEGLRVIGELQNLESLAVSNTQITNAGLAFISKLPVLGQLWLEPMRGTLSLSDEGLACFEGQTKLRSLTLVDRGFTDTAIPHVLKIPLIHELRLTETAIGPAGITALKKQRPTMRLLSQTNQ